MLVIKHTYYTNYIVIVLISYHTFSILLKIKIFNSPPLYITTDYQLKYFVFLKKKTI